MSSSTKGKFSVTFTTSVRINLSSGIVTLDSPLHFGAFYQINSSFGSASLFTFVTVVLDYVHTPLITATVNSNFVSSSLNSFSISLDALSGQLVVDSSNSVSGLLPCIIL